MLIGAFLAIAQFSFPMTHAYAFQQKKDVFVSITYETSIPVQACTEAYDLSDEELLNPLDSHCWKPDNIIGDIDVWKDTSINNRNFRVIVKYPNGKIVTINLTSYVNS